MRFVATSMGASSGEYRRRSRTKDRSPDHASVAQYAPSSRCASPLLHCMHNASVGH